MYGKIDVLNDLQQRRMLRDTSPEGTKAVANFSPTRFELLHLAQYWIRRIMELELSMTETGSISARYFDVIGYANLRLSETRSAVGGQEFESLLADEKDRARRLVGDRVWTAYESGRIDKVNKIREGFHSQMEDSCSVPVFAIIELACLAAARLPELPGHTLADVMRAAADSVEAGSAPSSDCNHTWATADPNNENGLLANCHFERCTLCRAVRNPTTGT